MSGGPKIRSTRGLLDQLARVHARLDNSPQLRPVEPGEEQTFDRYLLAAVAERALGLPEDPTAFTATRERDLRVQMDLPDRLLSARMRGYWITDRLSDVGVVSVDGYPDGRPLLTVHHLFVRPDMDRQALARAATEAVREAASAEGMPVATDRPGDSRTR